MDCELCGAKNANRVAIVEGVKMILCGRCVKTGREIHEKPVETSKGDIVTRKTAQIEETIITDYAKKIRSARQKTGIEQKELAAKLNEKQSIISKIESGSMRPTIPLAKKLEKFFGITLIEKSEPLEFKSEASGESLTLGDMIKLK